MATIVGLCGSLRKQSINAALLRAAAERAPSGLRIMIDTIRDIPLYDGDFEADVGIPLPVVALRTRIARADGILIATPEYNQGVPGVLKNAIDWLSRPPKDAGATFRGRPVGIMGASPGRFGTINAQTALLPTLRSLSTRPYLERTLLVGGASSMFENGKLVDVEMGERLEAYLKGFLEFVEFGSKP